MLLQPSTATCQRRRIRIIKTTFRSHMRKREISIRSAKKIRWVCEELWGCLHGEHFHGNWMQVIWATIPGRWCLLGDEGNEPAGVGRSYDQPRHRGGPGPDSRFQHFQCCNCCKNLTSICRPCKHARCTRDLCAWTHWWFIPSFRKKRDRHVRLVTLNPCGFFNEIFDIFWLSSMNELFRNQQY